MIEKLTKKQEKEIPVFIEKYLKLAEKPTDRKEATKAVQNLYKNAGKTKPIVIFGKTPLQTAIMVAMCKILFKDTVIKDDSQLDSQLYSQLRSQLDSQLYSQLDSQLRSQLYSQLYSQLRSQLDSQLDSQLRSQLYSQLDSQLRSQLYSQLDSQLRSQLDSQLDSQLYSQLDSQLDSQLRSQLYSQLDSQLRSQLYSQLDSQLRSQLDSQLRSQLDSQLGSINNDWWLVVWWITWAAWYAYGKYIGVKFDNKILKVFTDFVTNISFIIPYEGIAFVSETPEKISWDDGRLHSTERPAVDYGDELSNIYSIRGVNFGKELWEKVSKDQLTAKEVFDIENTEQRRIAYELMDKRKMLDLADYKVLDSREKDEKGNPDKVISFTVKGFDKPFIYYNCFCPSTMREYFLQTDKTTCVAAQSASFGEKEIIWTNQW